MALLSIKAGYLSISLYDTLIKVRSRRWVLLPGNRKRYGLNES
jgi:hypothetical protein